MSPVLEATGIGLRVGNADLVRDASLSLYIGELTVIVGPNSAGKSTLLKLLTRELRSHAGTIQFGSSAIAQLPS